MWMRQRRIVILGGLILGLIGCTPGPSARNLRPAGLSQAEMDWDYMECEFSARSANQQQFSSRSSPFPFGPGPQSPIDHARALHGLSTINAMRDTCLAAKGYRVE
jgi:hypothetical protein